MALDVLNYVRQLKLVFDRTVDCKHTPFDDLYPYMMEHEQFFWYKRHAAWASLLTVIEMADDARVNWRALFTESQISMIERKVLDRKVLDEWAELTTTANDAEA